jgi:hypothetical protein
MPALCGSRSPLGRERDVLIKVLSLILDLAIRVAIGFIKTFLAAAMDIVEKGLM